MGKGEVVVGHTEADGPTQPMPIVGELIVVMGHLYRCVSVSYADEKETQTGAAEIRVRFKAEGGDGA